MALTAQDIEKVLDLSGQNNVSATELNQLVDTAIVADDKGLVLTTVDTALDTPVIPDATADAPAGNPVKQLKWQRYLWRRVPFDNTGVVKAYLWNPQKTSDALLKWEQVTASTATAGTAPLFAETIADLKAIDVTDLPDNHAVFVESYYTPGSYVGAGGSTNMMKFGGGMFVWRIGLQFADDGGLFIKPTIEAVAGRWERIISGEIPNIAMWGAKGDYSNESADINTAAIQYALNAAAHNGFACMRVPKGCYFINKTIILWATVHLYGDGGHVSATLIRMVTGVKQHIFMTANAARNLDIETDANGDDIFGRGLDGSISYPKRDWDHNLHVNDLTISFDDDAPAAIGSNASGPIYPPGYDATINKTEACFVCALPGEAHSFNNVFFGGGAYGVLCYGAGNPGLTLRDCSAHQHWIAAVCIKPIPGESRDWIGLSVTLDRISSDNVFGPESNGSLLLLDNSMPNVTINDMKLEGVYSNGVVHWDVPTLTNSVDTQGMLYIKGGSAQSYQGRIEENALVKIACANPNTSANGGQRSPNVTISNVNLSQYKYLVYDITTGYGEYTDYYRMRYEGITGYTQGECHTPFTYEAFDTSAVKAYDKRISNSRNEFCYAHFEPAQVGWYRIAKGMRSAGVVGTYSLTSIYDRVKFEVVGGANPAIHVLRHAHQGGWFNKVRYYSERRVTDAGAEYYLEFIDVYVNAADVAYGLGLSGRAINVVYHGERATEFLSLPVLPTLVVGAVIDASACGGYIECDLTIPGIQLTGVGCKSSHLTLGGTHVWATEDGTLRHYNDSVKVAILGGGDGVTRVATARAFITAGAITGVRILDQGEGYTQTPKAYIIPNELNVGTGAVLVANFDANTGKVTTITVSNAGAGYGAKPLVDTAGRKLAYESEIGQTITASRRLPIGVTMTLAVTNGEYVATYAGADIRTTLFHGDVLLDKVNNVIYVVNTVISETAVLLESKYAHASGNVVFHLVGVRLLPPPGVGFSYSVFRTDLSVIGSTAPGAGTTNWDRIVLRGANTRHTDPAEHIAQWRGINDGTLMVPSSYVPAAAGVGGFGGQLADNHIVEVVFMQAGNLGANAGLTVPATGDPLRVNVSAVKNKSNYYKF